MIEQRLRKIVVMGRFGPMLDLPHQPASALILPHFDSAAETIQDFSVANINGQLARTEVILARTKASTVIRYPSILCLRMALSPADA